MARQRLERKPGYYWVRLTSDSAWEIAEWDCFNWYFTGNEQPITPFLIGPKVEPPAK